jgi:hypothetical protein
MECTCGGEGGEYEGGGGGAWCVCAWCVWVHSVCVHAVCAWCVCMLCVCVYSVDLVPPALVVSLRLHCRHRAEGSPERSEPPKDEEDGEAAGLPPYSLVQIIA